MNFRANFKEHCIGPKSNN